MAPLKATLAHGGARRYRRPGGPWDRAPLDGSAVAAAGTGQAGIVDDTGRLDGAAIEAAVAVLAGALAAAGARRGRVVAWQAPNSAAGFLLYRACWRLGAVAAPL